MDPFWYNYYASGYYGMRKKFFFCKILGYHPYYYPYGYNPYYAFGQYPNAFFPNGVQHFHAAPYNLNQPAIVPAIQPAQNFQPPVQNLAQNPPLTQFQSVLDLPDQRFSPITPEIATTAPMYSSFCKI
jgi:hypothetical protein